MGFLLVFCGNKLTLALKEHVLAWGRPTDRQTE